MTTTVTRIYSAGCGIEVAVNQTLLVYVSEQPPYWLSTCSRTGALDSATEEIKILDRLNTDSAKRSPEA